MEKDLYKKETVCNSKGICQDIVTTRNTFPLETSCWPDVSMESCKSIVTSCGSNNASIDRSLILSENTKASISCLENHRDVNHVALQQFGEPTNDRGREAVNIADLQAGDKWVDALSLTTQPGNEWLKDVEYTGEGILVGVYDSGTCYKHSGFYEIKQDGEKSYRTNDKIIPKCPTSYDHGTHVAGIIGGNGSHLDKDGKQVDGFKYRGIAPKVSFHMSNSYDVHEQIGHVANHSHIGDYYRDFDSSIFKDWKLKSDDGDNLSKLEVIAAGNSGGEKIKTQCCEQGYHSIKFDSKNAIVVGNYQSYNGEKNSHSSMGPTWDGRIKPDVMAPGSGLQASFDAQNPFVAYLDYIRIERSGFEWNFGDASTALRGGEPTCVDPNSSEGFLSCPYIRENVYNNANYVVDRDASNGYALKIVRNDPFASSCYINLYYKAFQSTSFEVKKGDVIKIRMKIPQRIRQMFSVLKGELFLGAGGDNGFYDAEKNLDNSIKKITFTWNLGKQGDEYYETNITWTESDVLSNYFRFDFNFDYGIISSVPCDENGGSCYGEMSGTSQAAPYVSGIAALMYQKYQKTTGESLELNSMRNSTAKAILIHTAVDMVDKVGYSRNRAQDIFVVENKYVANNKTEHLVKYGEGPDFATGWGKVDGKAALSFLDEKEYSKNKKQFKRFQEIEIENGIEKRWKTYVGANNGKFRVRLVWDDAVGETGKYDRKLVNDLDMYLISPSGRYYFPWRLAPLPTESVDENGNLDNDANRTSGLENIKESDILDAERFCGANDKIKYVCFDHLNNVEVIDVDNPEKGYWQIVVRGFEVHDGNNEDGSAQIASLVSDFPLNESECQIVHPYNPQSTYTCEYNFGDNLENFVTFDTRTFVGSGDFIYLYDGNGKSLGVYAGSALAGKRIKTKTKKIKVVLDSDNDDVQGWGFGVSKIEKTPFSILNMLFESTKKH